MQRQRGKAAVVPMAQKHHREERDRLVHAAKKALEQQGRQCGARAWARPPPLPCKLPLAPSCGSAPITMELHLDEASSDVLHSAYGESFKQTNRSQKARMAMCHARKGAM